MLFPEGKVRKTGKNETNGKNESEMNAKRLRKQNSILD
jgi:hypothetical protein